jgi:hypothetical protein
MTKSKMMDSMMAAAGKFVVKQKGQWEHDEWESLVAQVEKLGVKCDDEVRRNLGNMLEALKFFYSTTGHGETPKPKAAAKKKAASKAKPRAKAKPKAKAKAKPKKK